MTVTAATARCFGLSLLLPAALACACADEVEEPDEPRPTHDELLEFYTEFCALWLSCAPNPELTWSSVEACAVAQVDYYAPLPTACLDRVIVYHQCVIDLECDAYPASVPGQIDLGFYVCKAERDAVPDVDCGGMSAP